jgi:hypothetical protein
LPQTGAEGARSVVPTVTLFLRDAVERPTSRHPEARRRGGRQRTWAGAINAVQQADAPGIPGGPDPR